MADTKPSICLGIEELNTIALRLRDRSDEIRQITLVDLVADLKLAARACELLAHIRFELGEIAGKTSDQDAAREIRDLLDVTTVAEPEVGQP